MTIPHTPFIFIRHGETDWNKKNIAMGQQDIPLNETGVQQAHTAAQMLKGMPIGSVVSSSLCRASQTAEIISSSLGLSFEQDNNLREFSLGELEGQPKGNGNAFQAWRDGGQVRGAESYADFTQRVLTAMQADLRLSGPVLIVSHGGAYWPIQEVLGTAVFDLPNCAPIFHRPPETPKTPWFVYSIGDTSNLPIQSSVSSLVLE